MLFKQEAIQTSTGLSSKWVSMFNIGHQVYDLKEALGFPGIQSQYKQPQPPKESEMLILIWSF